MWQLLPLCRVSCLGLERCTSFPLLVSPLLSNEQHSSLGEERRPGFYRTWGVQVVSDMFDEEGFDHLQVVVRCGACTDAIGVEAELVGARLHIHVPTQPPLALSSFHVELAATSQGRIVLPLSIGPIRVASTLPRPLPLA